MRPEASAGGLWVRPVFRCSPPGGGALRLLLLSLVLLCLVCSMTLLHLVYAGATTCLGFPQLPMQADANPAPPKDTPPKPKVRFPRTKRRLPSCIIIGVRKGGTRALLEYLHLHPSIQKAADEVHFFNDDAKYKLGLEWYRRKMPFSFPDQITVEKTPAYFTTESVPDRIKAMNASIKLVLIVRDPVTRLVSDYAQLAANRAKRVKVLPTFQQSVILSDGTVNTDYKAVRSSLYYIYFQQWVETFSRQQIHVVDGDNMIRNPVAEVRKVEEFLGLGHRVSPDQFAYNKTKGFFCISNGTVAKCLNDSKGRPHPKVPSEVIGKLREFYAPHNRLFFDMVGRRFDWAEVP